MFDCTIAPCIATAERFVAAYRELADAHCKAADRSCVGGTIWAQHAEQAQHCRDQVAAWLRTVEKLKEEARSHE